MKGISPLLAIILLIAISLVVGGLIWVWITNFFGIREIVGWRTEKTLKCSNAKISFFNLKIEENDNLSGFLVNLGSEELNNITLYLISSEKSEVIALCKNGVATKCDSSNLTLSKGENIKFEIEITSKPEKIYVLTNCPDVVDIFDFQKYFMEVCLQNGKVCSSDWQCCSGYCKKDELGTFRKPEPLICCYADGCVYNGVCYSHCQFIDVGLWCVNGRYSDIGCG